MESGKVGMDYHPLRSAGARMPIEDQCRVRDRATIVSRHIFASRGEAFADAQVALSCTWVATAKLQLCTMSLLVRALSPTIAQYAGCEATGLAEHRPCGTAGQLGGGVQVHRVTPGS